MKAEVKLGAEPKKVAILIGLLAVAGVIFVSNSSENSGVPSGAPTALAPAPVTSGTPAAAAPRSASVQPARRAPNARAQRSLQEFRPTLKPRRPEDRADPMTVDPTLRLDLLARLQKVTVEGNHRSIFEFGQAPPPPKPEVAKSKGKPVPSPLLPEDSKPEAETAKAEPPKPRPTPIPLKFYGYIAPGAKGKRAFFIEGEEIHVASEGELVKRRYKIVRIGVNSVVVEDTQLKNEQTLPLEETPG